MWLRALTALGGAVLLGSLWLTWYSFAPSAEDVEALGRPSADGFQAVQGQFALVADLTAWNVMAVEAVVLATIAFVAGAALVRPVAAHAVRVLGAIAVALIVFRLLVPPETGFDATTGAYVALAAALVAWAGAWRADAP